MPSFLVIPHGAIHISSNEIGMMDVIHTSVNSFSLRLENHQYAYRPLVVVVQMGMVRWRLGFRRPGKPACDFHPDTSVMGVLAAAIHRYIFMHQSYRTLILASTVSHSLPFIPATLWAEKVSGSPLTKANRYFLLSVRSANLSRR